MGYVEGDLTPETGVASFPARSVSLDYNQRNVVVDLGEVAQVEVIQLFAGLGRAGNVRLDETNVELYCSNDNASYRPASFTYREPDPYVIEIGDIGISARYFKIHTTLADREPVRAEFSAGSDYGGARVFRKE